ncbi:MAG: hypothetical protein OEX97_07550, partial [Acidimicrobiia bacterium]|nr:hypothetical protein [Acidimicrobiia bacterium]
TLNDVGRGHVWPVGGVRLGLIPEHAFDGQIRPGLVPMLPFLSTGSVQNADVQTEHDGIWDGGFSDPARLPRGSYDLRIERTCLQNEHDDEDALKTCAVIEVDVRGETVVDLPELGVCP